MWYNIKNIKRGKKEDGKCLKGIDLNCDPDFVDKSHEYEKDYEEKNDDNCDEKFEIETCEKCENEKKFR